MVSPIPSIPFVAGLILRGVHRNPRTVLKRTANSAYPKVVSNLGGLSDTEDGRVALNMIRFMNHFARSIGERGMIIKFFQENQYVPPARFVDQVGMEEMPGAEAFKDLGGGKGINTKARMSMMNDYYAVGFANTIGYAHPNTGDTMTSVMIGGLRTVMNGDFEIFPGDLIQFYWYPPRLFAAHTPSRRLTRFVPVVAGLSRRTISFRMGEGSPTLTYGTGKLRAM